MLSISTSSGFLFIMSHFGLGHIVQLLPQTQQRDYSGGRRYDPSCSLDTRTVTAPAHTSSSVIIMRQESISLVPQQKRRRKKKVRQHRENQTRPTDTHPTGRHTNAMLKILHCVRASSQRGLILGFLELPQDLQTRKHTHTT